jgi:putative transport protein
VGYPESHEKLDVNYRNGKEVFDRNLLDLQIVTEEIVVKNDAVVGRHLVELNLTEKGCFLNRVVRSQIEMPFDRNIMLQKGDVLQISGEKQRVKLLANKIGFISIHSQTTDLVAFTTFFVLGLLIGSVSLVFGQIEFGLGNAVGLLLAGILMGYLRANHPTVGYVPPGALRLAKDLGLAVFMVSTGLKAGGGILDHLSEVGMVVLFSGMLVTTLPVLVGYLFGVWVLKMNPALLLGAITGPHLRPGHGRGERGGQQLHPGARLCRHLCGGQRHADPGGLLHHRLLVLARRPHQVHQLKGAAMAPFSFMGNTSWPDRAYRAMCPSPTKPNELKRPPHATYTQ